MSKKMTMDELCAIPFQFMVHMSTEGEHTSTYWNREYGIGFCEHQPYDSNGDPCGHTYTHYAYRCKIYKSAKAFLSAYNKETTHYIDEHKDKAQ